MSFDISPFLKIGMMIENIHASGHFPLFSILENINDRGELIRGLLEDDYRMIY